MSSHSFPGWLSPYKNEWRSMTALKGVMALEGDSLTVFVKSVEARLRTVQAPWQTGSKLCTKYLVKQVYAVARAHNKIVVPPVGVDAGLDVESLSRTISELRAMNAGLRRRIDELEDRKASLDRRDKRLKDKEYDVSERLNLIRHVAQLTEPRPSPGVYLLMNKGDVCYVGQSQNVLFRMSGHKDKEFDAARMIPCDGDRLALEAALISTLKPKYNEKLLNSTLTS